MRKIILGTSNQEKIEDLILALKIYSPEFVQDNDRNIVSLKDIEDSGFIINIANENGYTVEENCMSKLYFYKSILDKIDEFHGSLLISEDTGLFIRQLDWNPGVHTARFAGDHDFDKLGRKVMELMNGVNDRFAFVKSAVGATVIGSGEDSTKMESDVMYGSISDYIYSGNGFAFDKIFMKESDNITLAEMCNKYKLQRLYIPRFQCINGLMNDRDWLRVINGSLTF
jgi:XTP/dITP diphosphohydrolase